ncbi:MAG: NUDIX hydrolase [Sphingomonas sp. 28-66-16]|nr:MAG: NUDIX hydrolase [Sphingomonas sp. 28-66-16]
MPESAIAEPIPAATLVVFRDRPDGPSDLLIVERARAMVFAGGALVFPGGRIDPADHALARLTAPDDPYAAGRIAAIRETIEEAGLPVGLSPMPDVATLAAIRAALHAGTAFAAALHDHAIRLDLAALTPFARWCPRHRHMRIFDTLFFLAALPDGSPEPIVDATENSRVLWASAQQVLDDADAGKVSIIFPTRRNLERLALFTSHADAVADTRSRELRTVTPWAETRDGIEYLCIPDDLGYPVTAEAMSDTRRG